MSLAPHKCPSMSLAHHKHGEERTYPSLLCTPSGPVGGIPEVHADIASHGQRPMRPALRRLSVLMPVYNERWTLAEIVHRVLQSPVGLEIELVVVDDGSTDGSWGLLQALAEREPRIKLFRHDRNRGKGAAVRTAIAHMTGDVAVIQDADLEYDPAELPRLLEPLIAGRADAVFGSRYLGSIRRALPFWHSIANKALTLLASAVTNLVLSDMETCYKMVRADVLRQLRLQSETFAIEPELTCRLAQWGAEIYEVPIRYSARGYAEGKKIRPMDGLRAIAVLFRTALQWRRFSHSARLNRLARQARRPARHARLAGQLGPYLGPRVLHLGAGIGTLSRFLVDRPELVLVEWDATCRRVLERRLGDRSNVRIASRLQDVCNTWAGPAAGGAGGFDAIVCSEPAGDIEAVEGDWAAQCFRLLSPGGKWVLGGISMPAADRAIFAALLRAAGFELTAAHGSTAAAAGRPWWDRLKSLVLRSEPANVLVAYKPPADVQRAAA